MLTEKEKEWLERRKNLCNRCIKAAWCRTGEKHGYNTERCRFWELKVPNQSIILGALSEDLHDAAEFEARVAVKLATVICARCEDFNKKNICPLAIYQATGLYECRMMHARLAAEAEMDRKS